MTKMQFAGFWKRFGAALIDAFLLGIAINIVSNFFLHPVAVNNAGVVMNTEIRQGSAFMIVMQWLYFSFFESSDKQATPGKMALGIIVTDMQGKRLSFWHASGRWLAKILSALTLGIGYIMVAFTQKKQGLHDLVASTVVVNK